MPAKSWAKALVEANCHQKTFDVSLNLPGVEVKNLIEELKNLGCTVHAVPHNQNLYRVTCPSPGDR